MTAQGTSAGHRASVRKRASATSEHSSKGQSNATPDPVPVLFQMT